METLKCSSQSARRLKKELMLFSVNRVIGKNKNSVCRCVAAKRLQLISLSPAVLYRSKAAELTVHFSFSKICVTVEKVRL